MSCATMLTLARDGGREFDAYLARPEPVARPAVMVLHDMFGLNEPIRAVADRYAARALRRWCRTCSGVRRFPR